MEASLRPIERRVLALRASGFTTAEIAQRFRRGEGHIERIIAWTDIPRRLREKPRNEFRPVERRVLTLRDNGNSYEDIGARFKRDADFAKRVEDIALIRHQLGLISSD